MNASNPYKPPSTKPPSNSWRPIEFFVAGLWLAIPVGVVIGRQFLLPVFEDFEVELPIATQYLLGFYSPIRFAIASICVLMAMFMIPFGSTRRRFMWLACVAGVLVAGTCLLTFFVTLLSLLKNLS